MRSFRIMAWLVLAGVLVQSGAQFGATHANAQAQATQEPASSNDWINAELSRCRDLQWQALNDERCHAANRANWLRFLGQPRPYEPRIIDPFAGVSDHKLPGPTKPQHPPGE